MTRIRGCLCESPVMCNSHTWSTLLNLVAWQNFYMPTAKKRSSKQVQFFKNEILKIYKISKIISKLLIYFKNNFRNFLEIWGISSWKINPGSRCDVMQIESLFLVGFFISFPFTFMKNYYLDTHWWRNQNESWKAQ